MLYDFSMVGALIVEVSEPVATGTRLRLALPTRGGGPPARIAGDVVRETETGFAVRFGPIDPHARRMLTLAISEIAAAD